MDDHDFLSAVRWAIREGHFVFSQHAFMRLRMESLSTADVRDAGAASELLEDYLDRPEGHTMLLLGYAQARPVHIVTNVSGFESDWNEPVFVVTTYRPEPPIWLDERTRGLRRDD